MKKELSLVSIGFLIVLLVLPLIHPAFATTIFSDGFESGDFSAWTGTSGTPAIVTTPVHHGSKSAEFDAGGDVAYKTFTGQTILFFRTYARITALPATATFSFMVIRNAGGSKICELVFRHDADGYKIRLYYGFPTSGSQDYIWNYAVDTWYCFEIKFVKAAGTAGEYRVYIDGVERITLTGLDTSATTDASRIDIGWTSMSQTSTLNQDCVVVADTYIGVEAGGEEYSRSASQSLTLSLAASKLFEVTRPVTQAIGLMLSGTKLFDITRLASQTIYFVLDMGRIAEYHVSVSQTVTATLNVQRLGEFLRTASQSIGLSLQAIAETIASYFRNVALTITTTLNANRLIEVTRQASQILNFLFNGERLIEVTRVASQTLNFVLQGFGSIVTEFERLATLALTFTHGIMGMYGAPVDYALVLAAFAVVLAIVAVGWAATKKD